MIATVGLGEAGLIGLLLAVLVLGVLVVTGTRR